MTRRRLGIDDQPTERFKLAQKTTLELIGIIEKKEYDSEVLRGKIKDLRKSNADRVESYEKRIYTFMEDIESAADEINGLEDALRAARGKIPWVLQCVLNVLTQDYMPTPLENQPGAEIRAAMGAIRLMEHLADEVYWSTGEDHLNEDAQLAYDFDQLCKKALYIPRPRSPKLDQYGYPINGKSQRKWKKSLKQHYNEQLADPPPFATEWEEREWIEQLETLASSVIKRRRR